MRSGGGPVRRGAPPAAAARPAGAAAALRGAAVVAAAGGAGGAGGAAAPPAPPPPAAGAPPPPPPAPPPPLRAPPHFAAPTLSSRGGSRGGGATPPVGGGGGGGGGGAGAPPVPALPLGARPRAALAVPGVAARAGRAGGGGAAGAAAGGGGGAGAVAARPAAASGAAGAGAAFAAALRGGGGGGGGGAAGVARGGAGLGLGLGVGLGGAGAVAAAAWAPSAPAAAAAAAAPAFARRERLRFSLSDLLVSTTVGTGTFGRVRIAQHRASGAWFALKILKKAEVVRLQQVAHIRSEVEILRRVAHPFVVGLEGHMQDAARLYMLLEYVPGGELFSHLRREVRLADAAARFYAAEVALAFEYLHALGVVYRDLKPENLLLSRAGHVKIADFGFAKVVADRTYSLCGTPEYLAPEIIQSTGHSRGADWWAFGILIFEMLAGFPPFQGETPTVMYERILAGVIDFPGYFSADARDLIRKLLTADRTRRLGTLHGGAGDVKGHAWFKRVDWAGALAGALQPPFVPKVRSASDTSNFDAYPDSGDEGAKDVGPEHAAVFEAIDAL